MREWDGKAKNSRERESNHKFTREKFGNGNQIIITCGKNTGTGCQSRPVSFAWDNDEIKDECRQNVFQFRLVQRRTVCSWRKCAKWFWLYYWVADRCQFRRRMGGNSIMEGRCPDATILRRLGDSFKFVFFFHPVSIKSSAINLKLLFSTTSDPQALKQLNLTATLYYGKISFQLDIL